MLRRALLVVGVALLIVVLWRLGPAQIGNALRSVGWYIVPVMAMYILNQATRALALRLCVLRPRLLHYGQALAIRLSGEAMQSLTFTGPFLAEPTRAWLLTRHGLTLQEGFAATLTEFLISLCAGAVVSIAALAYLIRYFQPTGGVRTAAVTIIVGAAVFLIASAVAVQRRFYLIGTIIGTLSGIGILRGRLRPDIAWINRMEDLLLAVFRDRPRRFAVLVALEMVGEAALVAELFFLLRALDLPGRWLSAFVIEGASKIIALIFPFIPLQVGVSEASYTLIFNVMMLPAAAGFAVAFLRRIRSAAVASVGLALLTKLSAAEDDRQSPSR
jgi:hypothetical protein